MADALKAFVHDMRGKQQAKTAHLAAREMARHCDARIKRARKAFELIDTFAWSCVTTDNPKATKELQRRIGAVREALRNL